MLWAVRSSRDTDTAVTELLIEEIVAEKPKLLERRDINAITSDALPRLSALGGPRMRAWGLDD